MDNKFYVAVTAIVKRHDGRVLITKRTATKKKWPNKWTVPGGRVGTADFLGTPTEINNQWYGTLINAVKREVREETGIEIWNVQYLCDIAVPDTIIISFIAETSEENPMPVLQMEECDAFAWVTPEEAENYDLIDGILGEIKEACV